MMNAGMMKNRHGRTFKLAAITAAILALGACGGGGGGGGGMADAGTPATQATAGQTLVNNGGGYPAAPADPVPQPEPEPAPEPAPVPVPAPAPAPANSVVDYYGDSTIWGYASGKGGQVADTAPEIFAAALPKFNLPTQYTVRNEGVNSSTACKLLNGADGRHPAWDTQLANSNATVVIFNFGINDQWQNTMAEYKGCLAALAQKAKSRGKRVIFETPNLTRDSAPNSLDLWVAAMRDVAAQQGVPVIDQYAYLRQYLGSQSVYQICPDGLHPSDAVYRMKGEYAAAAFAALPQ